MHNLETKNKIVKPEQNKWIPQTWYLHHMIQKRKIFCQMSWKLIALFLARQIKT